LYNEFHFIFKYLIINLKDKHKLLIYPIKTTPANSDPPLLNIINSGQANNAV